jgi:GT2 family glycosyltransferase
MSVERLVSASILNGEACLPERIAAVVIGRNEGLRLQMCLESVVPLVSVVVYVDSGSQDGSLNAAHATGAKVVELDLTQSFSAARARNSGVDELLRLGAKVDYVQFLDGDCRLQEEWLAAGSQFLESHADYAVVCGRRRELCPQASIYNQLCDLEWDTPIGDALSCGGDALVRLSAFLQVGGFNAAVIAGEEPELCVRLRKAGWKIRRLDAEMTWHDAAMNRFGQWWKRAKRAGYAYAQGATLHGAPPERHWVRDTARIWLWGGILPLFIILLVAIMGLPGLAGLSLYVLLWIKTFVNSLGKQLKPQQAALWATACVLGKFPQLSGQLLFCWHHLAGKATSPIEYKTVGT